ncbi:hypothetical protein GOODEAATRI_012118, partial [Goodea atripinnis]
LNPPALLSMPRSPTSSEDEMAQSFSDYSDDCASDSSREETIYETIRATVEPSQNHMDDIHMNSLVIRVLIPDLQQTVSIVKLEGIYYLILESVLFLSARYLLLFHFFSCLPTSRQEMGLARWGSACSSLQSLIDAPASNGRDGKFLDEEHLLREYPQPFSKGVPCLEVQLILQAVKANCAEYGSFRGKTSELRCPY